MTVGGPSVGHRCVDRDEWSRWNGWITVVIMVSVLGLGMAPPGFPRNLPAATL